MKILSSPGSSVDFLVVVSSTLCNLLLEFSPSKEPIVESGAVDLLCQLTHKYVERRILIAETCSVLLPKVPASLRNSLVYSILNQLISDDRDVQVKFYQALKGCPSFSN